MAFRHAPEAAQPRGSRALHLTLLCLACVVVLFLVTWIELPGSVPSLYLYGDPPTEIDPPASWFAVGLIHRSSNQLPGQSPTEAGTYVELRALKTRILVFYGSLAAIVVLIGFALDPARRSPSPTP